MKKTLRLLIFTFFALVLIGTSANTRPTPPPAPSLTPPCDDGIEKIADCPDTGCGDFGDALLNRAKNNVPNTTSGTVKTLQQIRDMQQPAHWNTGSPRTSSIISGPGKEGTAVQIKGFLLRVKDEGGESCNCGLTRKADTDVHFAVVDDLEDDENTSITAEITPRVRHAGHSDWTFGKLNDLEGSYVKIVGLLMLDTKHIRQAQRLPGEPRWNKGLVRATNWEVHPIVRLWKCTTSKHACDHGHGWEEVP